MYRTAIIILTIFLTLTSCGRQATIGDDIEATVQARVIATTTVLSRPGQMPSPTPTSVTKSAGEAVPSIQVPLTATPAPLDYLTRGLMLLEEEDYKGAVYFISMALDDDCLRLTGVRCAVADADVVEAHYRLGVALYEIGLQEQSVVFLNESLIGAIEHLTEAILMKPGQPDYWFQRSLAQFSIRNYELASGDIREAIGLDQNKPSYYFQSGVVSAWLGNWDAVIEDLSNAIHLQPREIEYYIERSSAYESVDDYERAIADFNQITRLDPDNYKFFYERGDLVMQWLEGDAEDDPLLDSLFYRRSRFRLNLKSAIFSYSKAIELAPKNAFDLGDIYIDRGAAFYLLATHHEEAEKNFRAAVEDFNSGFDLCVDSKGFFCGSSVFPVLEEADTYVRRGLHI